MSLIVELIDDASGDTVSVATLLRKVKVLASRLDNVELAVWVEHELNGYPADAELPAHRGPFDVEVAGTFAGPFGSGVKNAPVPRVGFPAGMRNSWLFSHEYREPIAELEPFSHAEHELRAPWRADEIARANTLIMRGEVSLYEHMGLVEAWRKISPQQILGIIDTVRTRVLDLALSLEKTYPEAGQPGAPAATPEQVSRIHQVVTNNIYSGQANIAIGETVTQTVTVSEGDRAALTRALADAGLSAADLEALEAALDADVDAPSGRLGPNLSAWLTDLTMKAATAGAVSGSTHLVPIVAEHLAHYVGLA